MKKKILFVSGWPYKSGYFLMGPGFSPWNVAEIKIQGFSDKDIYIGHSMGSSIALELWLKNNNASVILVNPFIERKNVLLTFIDWLQYTYHEGTFNKKFLADFKYLPLNFIRLLKFPRRNYWDIIKRIPKDKLRVLHGNNDLYLCGRETIQKFHLMGINVKEIEDAGHNWHENFNEEILKIINK